MEVTIILKEGEVDGEGSENNWWKCVHKEILSQFLAFPPAPHRGQLPLPHPSRKLKFHSGKRLTQRDCGQRSLGTTVAGLLYWRLGDWGSIYILTKRDLLPPSPSHLIPKLFPKCVNLHQYVSIQRVITVDLLISRPAAHLLPWDLSVSDSRDLPSLYPVGLLLPESQVSFLVYSLFWAAHTTQKLPERESMGGNSFESQYAWKTLYSPLILDELLGGGLSIIWLFYGVFRLGSGKPHMPISLMAPPSSSCSASFSPPPFPPPLCLPSCLMHSQEQELCDSLTSVCLVPSTIPDTQQTFNLNSN